MSAREVRVNTSGFDFSCPSCGIAVHAEDVVYTLPVSALVTWPVCESCGLDWCSEHQMPFPLVPGRNTGR